MQIPLGQFQEVHSRLMHLGELGLGNGMATGHYIPLHALDEHLRLHNLVTGVGYVGQPVQPAAAGRPINGSIKELNLG